MFLEIMSAIDAQPLEWVWEGVIPVGQLTLFMGEPGIGKKSGGDGCHRALDAG